MAFNAASHKLTHIDPVAANLGGLALFALLAAALLKRHLRDHLRIWAEAVAVTKASDPARIRSVEIESPRESPAHGKPVTPASRCVLAYFPANMSAAPACCTSASFLSQAGFRVYPKP